MTVEYNHDVQTSRGFGNFVKLLFRWKGSIYKLVYLDLLLFTVLYVGIFCLYRLYLCDGHHEYQKRKFELVIKYCDKYGEKLPLSFVLGFYISQVVGRWWTQFMTCPWPDTLCILIASHLQGEGDRSRLMRRTFMRYINLAFTMTMIMMSPQAKARFPTFEHLVEAGFLMPHEKLIMQHLDEKTNYSKYWIPLIWAGSIAQRARHEGRIADDMALGHIVKNIAKFRSGLGDILGFDWANIPLVYTQAVTLALYVYFLAGLIGKQIAKTDDDTYFPFFLFAEFIFYMGWLKVGEVMLNPWGEDDDDFEVNWMIDRYFTVSYIIVDEMHSEHPEMLKDTYWDEVVPEDLPYTAAAMKFKTTHGGSTEKEDAKAKASKMDVANDKEIARDRMNSPVGHGSIAGKMSRGTKAPSRRGSKGSILSKEDYKMYMDNTFVPMEKDE